VLSYLTANPSRELVVSANQLSTQDWWYQSKPYFDCFISEVVVDEISLGDELASLKRKEAIKNISKLELNSAIEELGLAVGASNKKPRSIGKSTQASTI